MTSAIVETRGVAKTFGPIEAVRGVDLRVERGELFGLIGHNGAGKSTLFKMMLGLLPVSAGEIIIDGEPAHGPRFRAIRRKIGYLPENVILYDNLSGLETLHFFADLKAVPRSECPGLIEQVGLGAAGGRRVREYSKGMRQRLGFAQALLGQPQLLFLDEPTTGLDPGAIREFYQTLRELREQGVTMILTSHVLAEIQERVDRLAIMEDGKLRACGTVHELRTSLNPPLMIELVGSVELQARVVQALADLPVESVTGAGECVYVRVPREFKMAVLTRLGTVEGVHDLHVRDSSLEDVFFGYRS